MAADGHVYFLGEAMPRASTADPHLTLYTPEAMDIICRRIADPIGSSRPPPIVIGHGGPVVGRVVYAYRSQDNKLLVVGRVNGGATDAAYWLQKGSRFTAVGVSSVVAMDIKTNQVERRTLQHVALLIDEPPNEHHNTGRILWYGAAKDALANRVCTDYYTGKIAYIAPSVLRELQAERVSIGDDGELAL